MSRFTRIGSSSGKTIFPRNKEVNKTKWNLIVKGDGFGNNEQEFYTDRKDNVKIVGGELVITGIREKYKKQAVSPPPN